MEVRVYKPEPPKEKKIVRLKLVECEDYVLLCAVNGGGFPTPGGNLLLIRNDGIIQRKFHVAPDLEFQTDDSGRVVVE